MSSHVSVKQCLTTPLSQQETRLTVKGWVKTRREAADVSFIHLYDGSCHAPVQLVIPKSLINYTTDVSKLTAGCSLIAIGTRTASQGKGQTIELLVDTLTVVGFVEHPDTYPMAAKRHTLEHLREVAHLRPRTNIIGAVTRTRHCLSQAIHRFFHEQGFYWIHTPIITGSDCEGAGELFRVSTLDSLHPPQTTTGQTDFSQDFFGREAFLTVSGQLNAEAYCLAMSKVYTFGPTFRAENSHTSRHLAEFWMVEPEIAFAELNDICQLSQDLLRYLCQALLNEREDDINFFTQYVDSHCLTRLEQMAQTDFEIMTYTDAIHALQQAQQPFEYPVSWGLDLQSEHERFLAEVLCKKPVIIINYPASIKSFYMRLNEDGRTVAAMDVLAPGIGEIIGGSQREERLDYFDQRLTDCALDPTHYQWYRDLRRYGTVPHAGFGLGLERFVSYVTGVNNVRDVIPFPRTAGHIAY